ncbi:vacuolar calcium ion transporter-like protein /H(+) exchanger [Aaosphaeria arxii CBS 175.79]|uniref:Vacuolar calcium ion transporter-like protein /H(+) exchanger n=1 Tax=Aaosphaeria arxii CBS 175.79 TaxID=1450172 RepID=A0A6A5XA44_9PLEO|nr:vacuolar calcium ion transporter-like protein /H(+) exchanger [Aaosphaeria arxii CBS 175.79]KAF2009925.1 vacuolar calcium ion transporter-like protein /H(+) exchanger [Aaosphaeria arxii CBS 175.79]
MHQVRRKAHRIASRGGSESNFNPFARSHSRTLSDTENQIYHTRSENHIRPTVEEERRLESRQTEKEFGPPRHADTAPTASPTSTAMSHNLPGPVEEREVNAGNPEESNFSTNNSDKTYIETNGAPAVQKRARFKNAFKKGGKDEGNELERAETPGLSVEERKHRALKRKIPVGSQIRAVLFSSWINVLLLFVPVGFALYYAHIKNGDVPVFIINFIAIIPLAAMLSYATEELALRVGETFGGLLNATFGNAVELIVSIQALIKDEIVIVKTSLIGSMLSNLLLVLGMAFFCGGVNRIEQHFNVTVAQTAASLLALCIASLIIPTVFHEMLLEDAGPDGNKNQSLSRGTAIILLFVYGCYLVFQLKSHVTMYNAPSQKTPKNKSFKVEEGSASRGIAAIGAGTAAATGGMIHSDRIFKESDSDDEEDDEFEEPSLSVIGALITLAISTTLVAFCSEFMVSSIEGVTKSGTVSTTFVGLILLPIVGNAAEHATAVTVAIKDKMDLSIGVAVGSSMQIALLVLPFVVVLGWILGKDCMTLYFDTFQIALLFVSVLLVNYLIQDGKSHWLEGVLLMSSYLIIALAAWFYPNIKETEC